MLSIRNSLSLSFGGAMLIGMLVLGFSGYEQARQLLTSTAIRGTEQTAVVQSQRISEWVAGNEKELALLAELDVIRGFEPEKIQPLLIQYSNNRKDLSGLFYVTPQGQVWSTLAPTGYHNAGNNAHFRNMLSRKASHDLYSDVEIDPADGIAKVFLLKTIHTPHDEVAGLLGTGLRLDRLTEITNQVPVKGSYGWLINRDGLILAHPDEQVRLNFNILDGDKFGYQGLKSIGQHMREGKSGQGRIVTPTGENRLVVFTPVPGNSGWSYAISIPTQIIQAEAGTLIQKQILALGGLLIPMFVLIWFLAKRISKPIELLAQQTHRLADGHFSERLILASGTEKEIRHLADDFNQMAVSIGNMMNNLLESERSTAAANTELAHHRDALIASEARYQLAIEASNDILWDIDFLHQTTLISSRWEALYGPPATTPQSWLDMLQHLVHPDDWHDFKQHFHDLMHGFSHVFQSDFRLRLKDGNYRWRRARGQALCDEQGKVIRLCGSLTDIHEQKENEQKIQYMAFHDSLTGLPNRWLFLERLDQALQADCGPWQGALLFMNINRFKTLNDLYGHQEGDALLRQIAKRMDSLHKEDATFARLGGDEFVLLLPHVPNAEALQEVADAMLRFVRAPFSTGQHDYRLTASIGISLFPQDGNDPSELMRKADIALQVAKDAGRDGWRLFDSIMYERIQHKNETEQALRQALQQNEFALHYQPKMRLADSRICGFEALLRWTRPGIGPVAPVEFIPLAEETGQIVELGSWVLKTACTQLAEWRRAGHHHIHVAVNVSALQLKQGFADKVARVLVQNGLPAESLEIEITESVLMQSFSDHMSELVSLRELGVHIALDDFGTGYSSLSYLRQLPIQTVKIDKSFIDDLIDNPTTRHITGSIISLAHGLGLEVVAEGVEYLEQLSLLKEAGCEMGQGYYIDRPLPASAASELLTRNLLSRP